MFLVRPRLSRGVMIAVRYGQARVLTCLHARLPSVAHPRRTDTACQPPTRTNGVMGLFKPMFSTLMMSKFQSNLSSTIVTTTTHQCYRKTQLNVLTSGENAAVVIMTTTTSKGTTLGHFLMTLLVPLVSIQREFAKEAIVNLIQSPAFTIGGLESELQRMRRLRTWAAPTRRVTHANVLLSPNAPTTTVMQERHGGCQGHDRMSRMYYILSSKLEKSW